MMDMVTKAESKLICYNCKRTIEEGDDVGYIQGVPFCLKSDCDKVKKKTFWRK